MERAEPRRYAGELLIDDEAFYVSVKHFIVREEESVGFAFEGSDLLARGKFYVEGTALLQSDQTYHCGSAPLAYSQEGKEFTSQITFQLIEVPSRRGYVCHVLGHWRDNGNWTFTGKLTQVRRFRSVA